MDARVGIVRTITSKAKIMAQTDTGWQWFDARDIGVEGKGWRDTKADYDRLPARAEGVVRDAVWQLSRQPSGLSVEFATDATAIRARWQLVGSNLSHARMAELGCSGLDLYAQDPAGCWRWAGAAPPEGCQNAEQTLVETMEPVAHRFRLYLPLLNPVAALQIGVPTGAAFTPLAPRTSRPLLIYGTSICHGYCASRPGMTHAAILGRRLDWPVVNLGFAGSALMEPEVGELLAELDPAVYVIDAVPNMGAELLRERAETFILSLRRARPRTPIVVVEARPYTNSWICQSSREQDETRNAALRAAYERLLAAGVTGLAYVRGQSLFGDDAEGSMDSSHPSDLGFVRMAAALEPVLRALL